MQKRGLNGEYMKGVQSEDLKKYVRWNSAEIPVVIGVSAHRNIDEKFVPQIRREVAETIDEIRRLCPNSPIVMLNGLAEGGDLLCAEVAIEKGVKIYAVLPDVESEYLNPVDFSPEGINRYNAITGSRSLIGKFVAPDTEKIAPVIKNGANGEDSSAVGRHLRDYRFRQQTIYVSTHCHFLIALWDGEKASGGRYDCGAAAAVQFNLAHDYVHENGTEFHSPFDGAVVAITSPRKGKEYEKEMKVERRFLMPQGERSAGKMPDALKEILVRTDLFNYDYLKYCKKRKAALGKKVKEGEDVRSFVKQNTRTDDYLLGADEYEYGGEKLKRLHDCSKVASGISGAEKNKFLGHVKGLAVFGFLLILVFMLYDQLTLLWTVIAFFAMLIVVFAVFLFVKITENSNLSALFKLKGKSIDTHTKFIEYRALAETLRVQYYVTAYGLGGNVCNYFTWSHKNEIVWIRKAVEALLLGSDEVIWENDFLKEKYSKGGEGKIVSYLPVEESGFANLLFTKWVGKDSTTADYNENGQIGYHLIKKETTKKKAATHSALSTFAATVTVITYFVLFVLELIPGIDLGVEFWWVISPRMICKVILSIFTAVTFLLSYYYGKLCLERISGDSENMYNLYSVAVSRAEQIFCGQSAYLDDASKISAFKSLMSGLAREELVENGIWIAYNRENGTDLPI